MESTKENRVWRKGPPPHVGWWNASTEKDSGIWRWWSGEYWSPAVNQTSNPGDVLYASGRRGCQGAVRWNDYYPADARVPRVDPRPNDLAACAEAERARVRALGGVPAVGSRWRRMGATFEVLAVTDFKDLLGKVQVPHVLLKRVDDAYTEGRVECVRLNVFKAKAKAEPAGESLVSSVTSKLRALNDYEAAMVNPRLAIKAQILTAQGYRRTSNTHGMVSRIDRPDWVDVLAKAQHCSPADFYGPGEATPAANWCDHYRRGYSKDTLIVGTVLAKLIPTSGGDSTGYIPPFKGEIA
jgi:hypothetical protein